MKRIFYTYLLSLMLCIAATHNTFGLNTLSKIAKHSIAYTCSGIELLAGMNEINNIYRNHANFMAENRKEHSSNAPEAIVSFIEKLAQERNIKEIYTVIQDSDKYADYWCDSRKKTIYIPLKDSQELEELLQKNTLSDEEQKQFNKHLAKIHHEITHIKYNDVTYTHIYENSLGIVGSIAIIYGLNKLINKHFPNIPNNYILNNIAKIVRGIALIETSRFIARSNFYSRYAEQRADNEIPNDKSLLEVEYDEYREYHQIDIDNINNFKAASWTDIFNYLKGKDHKLSKLLRISTMKIIPIDWFNNPLIMNSLIYNRAEHPSNIHRALTFKKRIEKLEKRISLESNDYNNS